MSEPVTVSATLENLSQVLQLVQDAVAQCGFSPERADEVQVATEEAFVNIVRHAYETEGDCTVSCKVESGAVTVILEDSGRPFDPLSAPDPDLESDVDNRPIGGMGILLVKKFMDDVSYRRQGSKNVLAMTAGPREGSD
jgi:serine/threonine-protein kinase RsbW